MTEVPIVDEQALQELNAAAERYEGDYFGRALGAAEFDQALGEVLIVQGLSVGLMRQWRGYAHNDEVYESGDLGQINQMARLGSNLLRSLRPAEAYASHLAAQGDRLLSEEELPVADVSAAKEVLRGISVIARSFESDVTGLQSHLSVMLMEYQGKLMETQNDLNKEIKKLSTATTALTVVILVITLFAAVVAAIGALR